MVDTVLDRVAHRLAEAATADEVTEAVEVAIVGLTILGSERKWYYLMQLCLSASYETPSAIARELLESVIDDDDLVRALVFGHRIGEALHISLYGQAAGAETVAGRVTAMPARHWRPFAKDRWVTVASTRDVLRRLHVEGLTVPARKRAAWIARSLVKRCAALNAEIRNGALMRLTQHRAALCGPYWERLTQHSRRSAVQLSLHCSSAFLEARIRVGDVTAKTTLAIQPMIAPYLSPEERASVDTHFGLRFLSQRVFDLLRAIMTRDDVHRVRAFGHLLYFILLADIFAKPEVAAVIDALGESPTLVIATHGTLALVPFAALYDGAHYLGERFDIVTAPVQPPRLPFGASQPDFEGMTGGQPLRSRSLRVMADVATLAHASHELHAYREIADANGLDLEGVDSLASDAWSADTLRWLFDAPGIAILSAHVAPPRNDVAQASIVTGGGPNLAFAESIDRPVDTGLVVLAGCVSTSVTDWLGSGENSLVSLLRQRGAKAVIATLWPVNDFAARCYNEELVRGLAAGLSRAKAHGRAQRSVMLRQATTGQLLSGERLIRQPGQAGQTATPKSPQKFRLDHPYFWAGTTLTGAWR
jgi:hypothetical protein